MAEETLRISGGRLERLQCISAVLGIAAAAVVVTSSLSAAATVTSVVIIASLATRDTIVLGLERATIESMRVVCLKRSAYLLRHAVIEKGASSSSSSSSNGEGTEWGGEMRLVEITPWMEIA